MNLNRSDWSSGNTLDLLEVYGSILDGDTDYD